MIERDNRGGEYNREGITEEGHMIERDNRGGEYNREGITEGGENNRDGLQRRGK